MMPSQNQEKAAPCEQCVSPRARFQPPAAKPACLLGDLTEPSGVCRDKTMSFSCEKPLAVFFRAFAHYASARARPASRTSS
nr:MAG: MC006.1R [Molluscum contagiosum virus]